MMTTYTKQNAIGLIESMTGAVINPEFVQSDVFHPQAVFDTMTEYSIKEREALNARVEQIDADTYILRDMEEDGTKYDMYFVNGGAVWHHIPVLK